MVDHNFPFLYILKIIKLMKMKGINIIILFKFIKIYLYSFVNIYLKTRYFFSCANKFQNNFILIGLKLVLFEDY